MDLYGEAGHYVGTAMCLEPPVPLQIVSTDCTTASNMCICHVEMYCRHNTEIILWEQTKHHVYIQQGHALLLKTFYSKLLKHMWAPTLCQKAAKHGDLSANPVDNAYGQQTTLDQFMQMYSFWLK